VKVLRLCRGVEKKAMFIMDTFDTEVITHAADRDDQSIIVKLARRNNFHTLLIVA
jgi:hypothetical protein